MSYQDHVSLMLVLFLAAGAFFGGYYARKERLEARAQRHSQLTSSGSHAA